MISTMNTTQPPISKKRPDVVIDPALNENEAKILFPEKLKRANEVLRTAKLPANRNRR